MIYLACTYFLIQQPQKDQVTKTTKWSNNNKFSHIITWKVSEKCIIYLKDLRKCDAIDFIMTPNILSLYFWRLLYYISIFILSSCLFLLKPDVWAINIIILC